MPGLPKIALARLKANPDAPKSAGPPSGPEAFQGAEHPDANLLAALVEKTLTERERTQVLNHLAQCAECREIAALTLPEEVEAAEPIRVAARRRWSPWPVLRWGAMAAVLGALTVVVVLHPGMYRHQEISKVTQPPAPAGNIASAPQTVAPPPSAPPPPEPAEAKLQAEARESVGEMAAAGKVSATHRDRALDDKEVHAKAREQVTLMAASRPPTAYRAENVPAVKAEREEMKGANALTAGVPAEPSPPAAPAVAAASDEQVKSKVESPAGPAAMGATAQRVAVGGGNISASSAEAALAKSAPRVSALSALHMAAPAPTDETRGARKDIEIGAGAPAALWSVGPDGKVQRSTDGGKTIEQIRVARGIGFRAIAALGNDVWAGGWGGALFHSADGGATWTRTGITFEGNVLTETITSIQLRDPQHLTVTTASGSQWASDDAGQHWQKNP